MENIIFQENTPALIEELTKLYQSVGWTSYTDHPELMEKLLPGAYSYITAWHEEKLIGLIRTVSDGCYILYIQDLLVHPDYHRQGIGSELMNRMLEQSRNFRQVVLTTEDDEKTIQFYRSVGMMPMQETGAISFMKI